MQQSRYAIYRMEKRGAPAIGDRRSEACVVVHEHEGMSRRRDRAYVLNLRRRGRRAAALSSLASERELIRTDRSPRYAEQVAAAIEHAIIDQGLDRLVHVRDVLELTGSMADGQNSHTPPTAADLSAAAKQILEVLREQAQPMDAISLSSITRLPMAEVLDAVRELKDAGAVQQVDPEPVHERVA